MGGTVLFQDSLATRLNAMRPSAADLEHFLDAHPPPLSPGIPELVKYLQARTWVGCRDLQMLVCEGIWGCRSVGAHQGGSTRQCDGRSMELAPGAFRQISEPLSWPPTHTSGTQ